MARVLAAGHARGLVHRDVTAENVLLTPDGPKLLDFGIAARAGTPDDDRGTPPYVAPERLDGAATHPAVDVYALGVLLFAMITGRTPYPETTWEQLEAARRTAPPPRLTGVPHSVAALCQRCLAHDPDRRPSAAAAADALTAALKLGKRVRRGLAIAGAGAGAGVLALSLLAWLEYPPGELGPVVTAPTPSATLSAVPSAVPSATPSAVPAVTASHRITERVQVEMHTVRQAVDGFHATLERPGVCGSTGGDVALDIKQVLRGSLVTPGKEESGLAGLRRKLADREREGRLDPACRDELEIRLTEITAARRQP